MSEREHQIGIRLTADGKDVVGATREASAAVSQLDETQKRSTETRRAAREEANRQREAEANLKFETSEAKKAVEAQTVATKDGADEAQKFTDRLRDQAATLGMSKRETDAWRASQLQLTAAQRASVDSSLQQIAAHEREQASLKEMAGFATRAAAALVAFGVGKALMVKGAIDEADGLNKLSQSLAISVEGLSGYRHAMGLAGVSNRDFETSMRNLAKHAQDAQSGVGGARQSFALLGPEVLAAARAGAPLEKLLPLIADAFSRAPDGVNKTALAYELLGRSGERLIPVLNRGAQGLREAHEEAARLGLIISGDMARNAEAFNDNLAKIAKSLTSWKYAIGNDVLPSLNQLLVKLQEASKAAGGFWSGLALAATTGAENPQKRLAEIEQQLKLVEGERPEHGVPGVGGALRAMDGLAAARLNQERAYLKNLVDRRWQDDYDAYQDQLRGMGRGLGAPAEKVKKTPTGSLTGDFDRLFKNATEQEAALQAQLDGTEKLTAAERERAKVIADVEAGLVDLGSVEQKVILTRLDAVIALEKEARGREQATKATEASRKAYDDGMRAQERELAKLDEGNRKLREENQAIGLNTVATGELAAARLEAAAARMEEISMSAPHLAASEQELEQDRERIRLLRERAQLIREGAVAKSAEEARQKAADENKRMTDNIERALADSIMRGFDRGESYAKNFWNALVNGAKTAVLQPIIQPIVRPIAQAIGGTVSSIIGSIMPGAANGASFFNGASGIGAGGGGFPGAGSFMNFLSGGQTLADFGNFFGSIGSLTESGATFGLFDAIGGFAAANPLTAIAAVAAPFLLDGLFGGGGGPKASEIWLQGGPGAYGIGINNAAGGDPDMAQVHAFNAMLRDSSQYDQNVLSQYLGRVTGTGAPADTRTLISTLMGVLQPAAAAAQAAAQTQQEAAAKQLQAAAQQAALTQRDQQLSGQLSDAVRGLSDQLGIGSLQSARDALSISEYVSPMARLAGARGQYESTLAKARGGDLEAVGALPGTVQSLLGIGRDVYASGKGFQDLFKEANAGLGEILTRQQSVQNDILKDVPLSIRQASNDQIAELRRGFAAMTDELKAVQLELRRLKDAA